ncbi:d-isomer specific 2-hydroxyacid dehydrogenase-like protein [Strigomonas culicis]|uniref:D-isomer specific 2-hydroxyacid dehydrogenase-like protein n=2 Tax=Strigomonas culicis TaxID=28005 RepID=S9U4J2_9TRYP|nr:d-isomer specific 2-hydroxyacid dehydrogenase-like protein [Strigomonas culicis]|eukprot:EPY23689.1 d-isomer specific 2-hydroxyacid dehydrogenase-like protein [Strigomonas culicis]
MSITVCAYVVRPSIDLVSNFLRANLGAKAKDIVVGNSVDEFAAAKAAGGPIALIVENTAHDTLKSLCDDFDKSSDRRVKFIYSASAGVDAYRLHELKPELKGIPFHNAQGVYSRVLAEHVAFSMLYFNRYPWRLIQSKREKKWDRFNMTEVHGQKVAIMGYGDIGQQCGKLAAGLGMQVTGIRRRAPETPIDEYGVHVKTEAETDAVVAEADFVVGVLPGTSTTRHYFNKDFFRKMKPSAVFINIGRGMTQHEEDVCEALKNGTIRGAALDVFETEPLPETSPLWEVPDDKLLLSAHCADWTDGLIEHSLKNFTGIFESYSTKGTSDAYAVCVDKGY